MKQFLLLICSVLFLQLGSWAQVPVILDADIDSDVDDVEALAMVHALADQKKIKLLGIIVTSDDPYAPLCVSAINKYYGRPRLPIGFLKNQPGISHQSHYKYTQQISEEFPRRLKSYEQAEDAVSLYRKLLSDSPDSSVVIITIGHLTSLQSLLKSGPDANSPLWGKELIQKKAAKWLCMGGHFPSGKEANFYRPDPGSTVYSLAHWQKPVVFVGWEVGKDVLTGGPYLRDNISPKSPVYRTYQLYNNFAGRSSWDQIAVYLLDEGSQRFFDTMAHGYCHVNEDGSNVWKPSPDNPYQAYLTFRPDANKQALAKEIDDMVLNIVRRNWLGIRKK